MRQRSHDLAPRLWTVCSEKSAEARRIFSCSASYLAMENARIADMDMPSDSRGGGPAPLVRIDGDPVQPAMAEGEISLLSPCYTPSGFSSFHNLPAVSEPQSGSLRVSIAGPWYQD